MPEDTTSTLLMMYDNSLSQGDLISYQLGVMVVQSVLLFWLCVKRR